MSIIENLNVIHIVWDGPISVEQAKSATTGRDYGLYQIYGTHVVFGPDALLYIGQADSGTFCHRITNHECEWGRWEPYPVNVYLGRLAGLKQPEPQRWGELIDRAEAVLIYKIGVSYNSARIKSLPERYKKNPILVVNHGRRHRLPECVSTIAEFINTDTQGFEVFGLANDSVKPPVPVKPTAEGEKL